MIVDECDIEIGLYRSVVAISKFERGIDFHFVSRGQTWRGNVIFSDERQFNLFGRPGREWLGVE